MVESLDRRVNFFENWLVFLFVCSKPRTKVVEAWGKPVSIYRSIKSAGDNNDPPKLLRSVNMDR